MTDDGLFIQTSCRRYAPAGKLDADMGPLMRHPQLTLAFLLLAWDVISSWLLRR